MNTSDSTIEAIWNGPYSWPKFEAENGLHPIPKQPGIYLQTVEYNGGYLIYAAGITRRTVPKRFSEHTRYYRSGDYTVLDIIAMQHGIRKEVWHGWGWTQEKRIKFEERKPSIVASLQKQLAEFRIFVADVGIQPRTLERLEASIMHHLYQQPSPICDLPDKGMMLAPRWKSENPITVQNISSVLFHGIPTFLDI